MNKGTLATIVFINVLVSALVVVVALTLWTPEAPPPVSGEPETVDRSADADVAKLRADINRLEERIGMVEGKWTEVEELRRDVASMQDALAERVAAGAVATEPEPKLTPEEERAKKMQEAMAAMMSQGARMMGRNVLERIMADDEEARADGERRARAEAGRLARRLDLDEGRAAALETAFVEVDQRVRADLRARIEAKGIDNVTYDDVGPAMDDAFSQRERAAETILTPTEMTTYKREQDGQKRQIDTMMKAAFPSASEGSGR